MKIKSFLIVPSRLNNSNMKENYMIHRKLFFDYRKVVYCALISTFLLAGCKEDANEEAEKELDLIQEVLREYYQAEGVGEIFEQAQLDKMEQVLIHIEEIQEEYPDSEVAKNISQNLAFYGLSKEMVQMEIGRLKQNIQAASLFESVLNNYNNVIQSQTTSYDLEDYQIEMEEMEAIKLKIEEIISKYPESRYTSEILYNPSTGLGLEELTNRINELNDLSSCGVRKVPAGATTESIDLLDHNNEPFNSQAADETNLMLYFGSTFDTMVSESDHKRNLESVALLNDRGISIIYAFVAIEPNESDKYDPKKFQDFENTSFTFLHGTAEQVQFTTENYRVFYRITDEYVDHSTYTYLQLAGEGVVEIFERTFTPELVADKIECFIPQ